MFPYGNHKKQWIYARNPNIKSTVYNSINNGKYNLFFQLVQDLDEGFPFYRLADVIVHPCLQALFPVSL